MHEKYEKVRALQIDRQLYTVHPSRRFAIYTQMSISFDVSEGATSDLTSGQNVP